VTKRWAARSNPSPRISATVQATAVRPPQSSGAGACLFTDAWEGIDLFLAPGREVLVARDGAEVAALLDRVTRDTSAAIGQAALARVRAEHTYDRRAAEAHRLFRRARAVAEAAE
jgi:spore maturation protein CgeB